MDTTGLNQIGRYGTLSLLRRQNPGAAAAATSNTQPKEATGSPGQSQSQVITSFGIDSANLTFGRSFGCDVRLYYQEVDPVHCRLVNEDGKAFLAVRGKAGVLIDGCWVHPRNLSSSNDESEELQETITPLTNNSEFEIHSKRFRFTYPPKEVRKVLLATPVAQRNRSLRLSMIQSAQVFTPRPSKDPRENLRILQSPLKTSVFGVGSSTDAGARDRSTSPNKHRAVSPLKFGVGPDDSDSDEDIADELDENHDASERNEEEQIILAHTNHPRVVEEDRDLVILEDVPLHLVLPSPSVYSAGSPARPVSQPGNMGPPATPTPVIAQPQPQQMQSQPQPPRTPRRKSLGGTALHRAVLIRSAQRAVWRAEREREDEEEEMEVLGAVVAPGEPDEREEDGMMEDENEYEQEDVEMRSVSDSDEEGSTEGDEEIEEDDNGGEDKPLWKKGLERIIPWTFSATKDGKGEEEKAEGPHADDNDDEHNDDEQNEKLAALSTLPQQQTPIRRVFGSFMTPQAGQPAQARKNIFPSTTATTSRGSGGPAETTDAGPGRYSLGGGEARRVVVQQLWRVKDLVVPPMAVTQSSTPVGAPGLRPMDPPSTPGFSTAPRQSISEEERKAIQERRRSAVREVREDSFWKDGAPGMSPAKVRPSPAKPPLGLGVGLGRPSVITTPSIGGGTMTPRRPFVSPTKGRSLGYSIAEAEGEECDSMFLDNNVGSGQDKPSKSAAVDDVDESTVGLLERMRETVEDMKRRRSVATLATPRTTLLDGDSTGIPDATIRGSVKKLDFARITPAQPKKTADTGSYATPSMVHGSGASALSSGATKVNDGEARLATKEPEPFSLLRPGARPSLSPKKRELRSNGGDIPVVFVDSVNDEARAPEQTDANSKGGTKSRSRLLRAPKEMAEPVDDQIVEEEEEPAAQSKTKSGTKPASKSKPASGSKPRSRTAKSLAPPTIPAPEPSGSGPRRQRSRTPQPRPPIGKAEPEPEVEEAPTRSVPRRTRKGTAEPEEPVAAPKRKGKKAESEPEPEEEVDTEEEEVVVEKVKPTPAKRGRKPRAAATPTPVEEDEEEVLPPPTVKRGRTKKVKEPIPTVEEGDEEDELDSYNIAPPPPASKKPRIPGRMPTLARAQKKAKEDSNIGPSVEEEEEPAPLATTRGGRGARANTNTTTTKTPAPVATSRTKTPANTTTAGKAMATAGTGKSRGRPKTPASAPAVVPASAIADDVAEKENTPGAGSGSANGSDEEPVVAKVRVSRKAGTTGAAAGSGKAAKTTSRAKAKAGLKPEQNDEEEEETVAVGRTRATRIMRTRTKTG